MPVLPCRVQVVAVAIGMFSGLATGPAPSLCAQDTPNVRRPATVTVPPDHVERAKQGTALFRDHVRQILTQHCLDCHGGKSTKADFDLSSHEMLIRSGYVTEPVDDSHLLQLIMHAQEPHMPFKLPKLSDRQIGYVRQWLKLGAPYDRPLIESAAAEAPLEMQVTDHDRQFWSFRPLANVDVPEVRDTDWCRTDIDRFIRWQQEQADVRPNETATRRQLIRRASLDLLGLPPTPDEVDAFVNDADPEAWPRLIDRLLASPHYGERWARHWMDVARFAESHGYEQDYDRKTAFHYRDFLIRAFNSDLPWDQFVRWQLAGDELDPDNPLAMMATGFLGAGAFPTQLTENEFESARYDELDDMVTTTGVAFLGLSVGCARCHDHKFDPIPTRDYYRLAATFTTTIRSEVELDPAPDDNRKRRDDGTSRDADLQAQTVPEPPVAKVLVTTEGRPHLPHHADGRGFPHFYPQTFRLKRGDVHQKQEEASAGFLQVLMPASADERFWQVTDSERHGATSFRRAALANWMTDAGQGAGSLVARVIVNRLWHHHLGRGLVVTPNDFGVSGERPSHPELLDWLASDLIRHGWTLKRVHRQIMNSRVYQQSADFDEDRAGRDPENRLLWRWTPRRLEAEAIRDSLLAVSGTLDPTMYGPGTLDQSMRRRSIYFFIKRSQLIPSMMLFDWPEHLVSIGQRATTTIAPQALMFLNSPQGRAYAEALAAELPQTSPEQAVTEACRRVFARTPTPQEQQLATAFIARQESLYQSTDATNARKNALTDFCQMLLSTNEFIYLE